MRFVWITIPSARFPSGSAEKPSVPEKGLGHREITEQEKDLQTYLDRLEKRGDQRIGLAKI